MAFVSVLDSLCACGDLQAHEKPYLFSGEQAGHKGAAYAILCREEQKQTEFVMERDLT